MSRPRKRLLITLFIALALCLGYAAQRGWIAGDSDFTGLHDTAPR